MTRTQNGKDFVAGINVILQNSNGCELMDVECLKE